MDARPIRTEYEFPTAYSGWDHQEIDAINRVVASNHYTCGPEVEAFEYEFATYHAMKYAIAVNSGSSANLISVAALCEHSLEPGDTVAVPALAWATTFSPLVQYGLDLMLCDAGGGTWNVNTIPGRPKLIVACPILGNPAYIAECGELSRKADIPMLLDNCESIGARCTDGALCGTQGLLNTFSFYFSHQMSAIEGGMILTNDDDLADDCRILRSHGWTRGVREPRSFEGEYEFTGHGYNVRPQEINAAIARVQLRKLDARIEARMKNWRYWYAASRDLPIVHPVMHGQPSPFGIHFEVASREVRQRLANALRANGIDCRPPVAGSFRRQPYGARWADQATPNADRIHDQGIMIGNPPFDGSALIDRAVKVMGEVL
jgi:CDP-6-deoxy-D-xylo-4-hexulose-3-dehydrase